MLLTSIVSEHPKDEEMWWTNEIKCINFGMLVEVEYELRLKMCVCVYKYFFLRKVITTVTDCHQKCHHTVHMLINISVLLLMVLVSQVW